MFWQQVFYSILFFLPFIFFFWSLKKMWRVWVFYRQKRFLLSKERTVLEIRIPKEIEKTPLAMEIVLNSLIDTGREGNNYSKFWKGSSRPFFSLEIVSDGGEVKFFVWIESYFKDLFTSHLYAQYPTVEIVEVPDYTKFVDFKEGDTSLFGAEFKLGKADPIPIKTYKRFGLEKTGQKGYEISDPLSSLLESLGVLEDGEQIWLQIVCRAHKKEIIKRLSWSEMLKSKKFKDKFKKSKKVDWGEAAEKIITETREKTEEKLEGGIKFQRIMTSDEKDLITAVEENVSKPAFDCGIRAIYVSSADKFKAVRGINMMLGIWKPFISKSLNFFVPAFVSDFDYNWHDPSKNRIKKVKQRLFRDYKRREFFSSKYHFFFSRAKVWFLGKRYNKFVLSTEELATIYHFPGSVVQTPTFDRISSKKGSPPLNLPT